MALFKISVKRKAVVRGVYLEPGMSVEISTSGYNPLTTNGGQDVSNAFLRIYGIDLIKIGACNTGYLDSKKIG